MILVTSYQDPDLDGTACSVGEAEVLVHQGEDAVAGVFGKLHVEAQAVIRTFGLEWPMNADELIDHADEIVHADQFLGEFAQEIPGVLKRLEEQNQLDTGFLSIIDIDNGNDIFLCEDEWLRDALSKAMGVSWTGNRTTTSGIMMRKELVPLLRQILG
ncbi:MAG: hypothetical protein NUV84_05045 [Candidatus Uhrbacteria bacterium]|nr:hypothetical protein [Candidatus Uhrbacteria bacterium]